MISRTNVNPVLYCKEMKRSSESTDLYTSNPLLIHNNTLKRLDPKYVLNLDIKMQTVKSYVLTEDQDQSLWDMDLQNDIEDILHDPYYQRPAKHEEIQTVLTKTT